MILWLLPFSWVKPPTHDQFFAKNLPWIAVAELFVTNESLDKCFSFEFTFPNSKRHPNFVSKYYHKENAKKLFAIAKAMNICRIILFRPFLVPFCDQMSKFQYIFIGNWWIFDYVGLIVYVGFFFFKYPHKHTLI